MSQTIGFIGLGTMGSGMVSNLLKKGYAVAAYNRTAKEFPFSADSKFSTASTPKEICAKAKIIFVCVTNDAALEDVLFSKHGAIPALSASHILIDCSTTSLAMTKKIMAACKESGAAFLDAPLTGSKMAAAGGTLVFMVGGEKQVLETVRPFMQAMGRLIVHCGTNLLGQKAKHALNLSQALVLQSYLEGLTLGLKLGVSQDAMIEILDNSGAKSNISAFKMEYILKGDFAPHFKLGLMRKDLQFALSEIKELGLDHPLSKHILEVYDQAARMDLSDEDICATVKVLEKKTDTTLQMHTDLK